MATAHKKSITANGFVIIRSVIQMNKVCFPLWENEVDKITTEIYRVTAQFKHVGKKLEKHDISHKEFELFFDNICQTLNFWTGCTHVGQKKQKALQKAFQAFFEALYAFLLNCRYLDNSMLQDFVNKSLYHGVLYRYLGHGSVDDNIDSKIEPEYSNIYVSWSKKPQNDYIEHKLYGVMTLLTCNIMGTYYGIDLEAFGVVRGDEAEVIFPTIEETITDIKYIER